MKRTFQRKAKNMKRYDLKYRKDIVIVIDPGHGGTGEDVDDGACYDGITERSINMATAEAMYQELSSYEGVQVYLTHNSEDARMSLRERVEFAKSVNADYLLSLHYNASDEHIFYGSEVWIPSSGAEYAKGYQLGHVFLEEFTQMGLINRGIKTKVNESGSDYYGIIRECKSLGITGIIVEHCYLDEKKDATYRDEEADYIKFGIADATSVAKFLGLKKPEAGIDYSSYVNIEVPVPENVVYQDMTPPDQCVVQLYEIPTKPGTIDLIVRANDENSSLVYYSYSLDGGLTFSELFPWVESGEKNVMHISISGINSSDVELIMRVYNEYNLVTSSGILAISGIPEQNVKAQSLESSQQTVFGGINKKAIEPFVAFALVALFLLTLVVIKKVYGKTLS